MIDLQQYRYSIGCFNLKSQSYGFCSPCNITLYTIIILGRVVEIVQVLYNDANIAPLAYYDILSCYNDVMQMYYCLCCRLLLSGDVELNPGPTGYRQCPQCNNQVHIKRLICVSCGYALCNKGKGRPIGTTSQLGYNVPTGHPGRPVGTTRDAGSNVGTGHPIGTTSDAGSSVSTGRPIGTSRDEGGGTCYIEDDNIKLQEHLSQYPDLIAKWNTDSASLSVSSELLKRGKKRIGQQVRFDSKPLGIAMLWQHTVVQGRW